MLRARFLPLLMAIAVALSGCSGAPPDCSIHLVARMPLQIVNGLPLVPVSIDGHPTRMIADTGAERSILTERAVTQLHLARDIGHFSHTVGIGGPSTGWDAKVDSLVMGGVRFPVDRMAVGRFDIGPSTDDAPAGLLGSDILLAFDLDIDIADNSIALYRARRCPGIRPPWQEAAIPIPGVSTRKDRVLVPLRLDGTAAMGVLDTGAQHTTIGSELAERLGVTDAAMAADPVIMQHGAGPNPVPSYLHRFASLSIGPATTMDPRLTVVRSDFGVGDALVGQDFLKGRRVWISFATQQVFVTALPGDGALASAKYGRSEEEAAAPTD